MLGDTACVSNKFRKYTLLLVGCDEDSVLVYTSQMLLESEEGKTTRLIERCKGQGFEKGKKALTGSSFCVTSLLGTEEPMRLRD